MTIKVLSTRFAAKVERLSIDVPVGRGFLDLEDDPAHSAVSSLAQMSTGLPDNISYAAGNPQAATSFAAPERLVGWLPGLQL
jgi:hypothetical protein